MLPYFKFHHVGIATPSIEKTSRYYLDAGYACTEPVVDPIQDIRISFLTKAGMPTFELLEPVDEHSPVVKFLADSKGGATPYHICYEVPDIDVAIKDLRRLRFIPLSRPVPAVAMGGHRVCFLYNKDVGLIELYCPHD